MAKRQLTHNLEILKASRAMPKSGDVFVFRPKGRGFYYGRVVNPEVWIVDLMNRKPTWAGTLVYIYRIAKSVPLPIPPLPIEALLLPPQIIDRACWQVGLLQTVATYPLSKDDVLSQHCFRMPDGSYVDEAGNTLATATQPCGGYGLTPCRGLDDKISRAIDLPVAPD